MQTLTNLQDRLFLILTHVIKTEYEDRRYYKQDKLIYEYAERQGVKNDTYACYSASLFGIVKTRTFTVEVN